jgi:hypothetical protein
MQRCIVATLIGPSYDGNKKHISYSPTSPASPFVVRPSDQTVAHSRTLSGLRLCATVWSEGRTTNGDAGEVGE